MLAACRLAGLSALETYYGGLNARANKPMRRQRARSELTSTERGRAMRYVLGQYQVLIAVPAWCALSSPPRMRLSVAGLWRVNGELLPTADHSRVARTMIKIAIRVEAFEAIARTLPLGSVGYEARPMGDDPAFVISAQSRSPGRSRNSQYRPLRPIRFHPCASGGAPSHLARRRR